VCVFARAQTRRRIEANGRRHGKKSPSKFFGTLPRTPKSTKMFDEQKTKMRSTQRRSIQRPAAKQVRESIAFAHFHLFGRYPG
jgi:hypothetical protein